MGLVVGFFVQDLRLFESITGTFPPFNINKSFRSSLTPPLDIIQAGSFHKKSLQVYQVSVHLLEEEDLLATSLRSITLSPDNELLNVV